MNFLKQLFYKKIQRELDGSKRVIDLACGKSSILEHLHKNFYAVGVDAYVPYIEISKQKGTHDEYVVHDILTVDFPPKSFDAVICFELIEHVEKDEGFALLKKMETWVTKKIILTTPNGFVPQEEGDGNDLQAHKSGWSPSDFRKLGFKVRGLQGLRVFARSENPVGKALWYLSFPLVYFFPSISWRLLAIKTLD